MMADIREQGYKPYQASRMEKAMDRAIGIFAPKVALQNAVFREKRHAFGYEGARITRFRENATRAGTITSNTPLNASDRLQLVWEARDLAMNDPFIHGLMDKMAHYVIGPRIMIEVQSGDKDEDIMIEDYLYECMENCDLTERSKYTDYTRLAFISVVRDGDFGSAFHEVSDPDPFGGMKPQNFIKLQACESDVIGGYHYWIEHNVVSGIEFDPPTGKVLSYRIYPRNNYGYYEAKYTAIPSHQFNFLSYRQRTDQYRGVTALASAIPTARDIKEIILNEKIGVKWANSWAGFIKTAPGDASVSDPASVYQAQVPFGALPTVGAGGNPNLTSMWYEDFRPAQVGHLSPGESIEAAKTDRPSSAFAGFLALLYRQVCVSLNVPFGFAFDSTALGGTVARLESAQAKRTFEWWQAYLNDNMHQPIFRKWIGNGIVSGRLRLKNLTKMPRISVCAPAHPTMDVGRESRADVMEYNARIGTSFSDLARERGMNPRDLINRIADDAVMAIDAAKERGIPPEFVLTKPASNSGGGNRGGDSQGGGGGSSDPGAGITSM